MRLRTAHNNNSNTTDARMPASHTPFNDGGAPQAVATCERQQRERLLCLRWLTTGNNRGRSSRPSIYIPRTRLKRMTSARPSVEGKGAKGVHVWRRPPLGSVLAAPPRLRDSADSCGAKGLETPSEHKCNDSMSLPTQREDCCRLKTKIFFFLF